MDAFFASVEVLDDPSLAGKPVIVGGAGARGVVASCTYEARVNSACTRPCRRCGPASSAPRPSSCRAATAATPRSAGSCTRILHDVTPMVEPIGLDEAFMDVAGALRLLGPPEVIAAACASGWTTSCTSLCGGHRAFQNDRQAGLAGGQAPGHAATVSNRGRACT